MGQATDVKSGNKLTSSQEANGQQTNGHQGRQSSYYEWPVGNIPLSVSAAEIRRHPGADPSANGQR